MTRTKCLLGAAVAAMGAAAPALAGSGGILTHRMDIGSVPLAIYNFAQFEDYFFPGVDGTIVETRVHLEFHTETFFGDFDAANFGLTLLAPIDGAGGSEVGYHRLIGSELGWSGSGEFVFDGDDFPAVNGELLTPGFPGAPLFYGLDYFHPFNITDPPPANPMQLGGQLFNSYIEVDYVLDVPSPGVMSMAPLVALATRRRR